MALDVAGGAVDVDLQGRLMAGPPSRPLPGDAIAWLRLVARGLVAGERDRLMLTEDGREEVARIKAGMVREARS